MTEMYTQSLYEQYVEQRKREGRSYGSESDFMNYMECRGGGYGECFICDEMAREHGYPEKKYPCRCARCKQ